MAVFGPGIHLRAGHLHLSGLWLWCEDGVIGHPGAPLSEPVSSVDSYRACLLLLQVPESLFLQGCLEAAGLSVYLPPHLSQPSTPLLVSFHHQQICCVSLTLFAVCLSFPVVRMLGLLIPASEIWQKLIPRLLNMTDFCFSIPFFFCHFIFLNCRILALQNFVLFCQTSTRISHRYTHVPSAPASLPSPSPSHPSGLSESSCLSSLSHTANSHWLSILHMLL